MYKHDCDACKYLGSTDEVDMYFCEQGGNMPTVIARYGSLGHQYTSGLVAADYSPWLKEAKTRAIAEGFLPKNS
jgi:hypothetical protein